MNARRFLSPWLTQLQKERPHFNLQGDTACDIVVVGAGIAGVSTAYFIARNTSHSVLLIDAGRIAHGATGHNAGQVVSYFERPLTDIARAFGVEMAMQGQAAIESGWGLVEDIIAECKLQTPLYTCMGYAGFSTNEQVIEHLEEQELRKSAGLMDEPMLIKVDPALMTQIPAHLHAHLLPVPHSVILEALQTDDAAFIAAAPSKKGCMNSALFCEELVAWMLQRYVGRFRVSEHLRVHEITLGEQRATLSTSGPNITAERVVLCTNGFENFNIRNQAGPDIDVSFHASVYANIGYMAGYLGAAGQSATAISYYRGKQDTLDPYHYLTRRRYAPGSDAEATLLCIGGPERTLPDDAEYDGLAAFPADIEEQLDRELRSIYRHTPPYAARTFLWHGLMGYTPNRLRRIGFEPKNTSLLYNLGCNGVGILPSVYGGKRIAQLVAGIQLPPSIFDPDKGDR